LLLAAEGPHPGQLKVRRISPRTSSICTTFGVNAAGPRAP
jgi:hypothetical protein